MSRSETLPLSAGGGAPFRELGAFAYRVCYKGGVSVRSAPDFGAAPTGELLPWGRVLWASERLAHAGGETVFVRLDGARAGGGGGARGGGRCKAQPDV